MYQVGDKVIYGPSKHKAQVIKTYYNGQCIIEFEDKDLIPPQMEVDEKDLSLDTFDPLFNFWGSYRLSPIFGEDCCPQCGEKWKETWIGHEMFYDCIKCNIKREDTRGR